MYRSNIMITIYGSLISPFVRKVLTVLEFKNVPYMLEQLSSINQEHQQQILKMNPLGKIPILKDGDFIIPDSSVICAYLEKKFPENPIYPSQAESYAKSLWYEEYADTQLFSAGRTVFFNKVLAPFCNKVADMSAIKDSLENKLPEIYNYLDKEISSKVYLVDNKISIADFSMLPEFLNLEFCGHFVDAKQWPNLARYIHQLSNEKIIKEIITKTKNRFKERFGDKVFQ